MLSDTPEQRAKKSAKIGATHFISAPPGKLGMTFENVEGYKHTYVKVASILVDSPLADKVGVGWLLMRVDGVYAISCGD